MQKHPLVDEILISKAEIIKRCQEISNAIDKFYKEKNIKEIILVGILKGCIPFLAQLLNYLTIECETEYLTVTSFLGSIEANQEPKIARDFDTNINNRDVLIVEDIIDTGYSLDLIIKHLKLKGANSIKIVTLLDKTMKRKVELNADWVGFNVPDKFLIGYGLDFQEKLRNLPYVATANMSKIKNWDWNKH